MATKAKNGAESAMKDGAEAMKQGYDRLMSFGKDNAEAWLKAAGAAGKGMETLHGEIFAYSRHSLDEGVTAAKAVLASKSVNEAVEIQTDFVRSAFDAYVQQITKFSDMALTVAKHAAEPLQERTNAFVELVQNARAA